MTLVDARQRRRDAVKLLAAGVNPSEECKTGKVAAAAKAKALRLADFGLPAQGTFDHVAREWLTTVHGVKVSVGHAERTALRHRSGAGIRRSTRQAGIESIGWSRDALRHEKHTDYGLTGSWSEPC